MEYRGRGRGCAKEKTSPSYASNLREKRLVELSALTIIIKTSCNMIKEFQALCQDAKHRGSVVYIFLSPEAWGYITKGIVESSFMVKESL